MESAIFVSCEVYRLRWGPNTSLVILETKTSDGKTGLGEASMSGDDAAAVEDIKDMFAGTIRGRSVDEIPYLIGTLGRCAVDSGSFILSTAASALEQSLWDIRGQIFNLPISSLIGEVKTTAVPLYANINRITGERSPQSFANQAVAAKKAGFSALKCAPFDEVLPAPFENGDEILQPGFERLWAIRSAIGNDIDLMVDCHGRLGANRAISVLKELEKLSIKWLEEPVVTNNEMWRVIRRRSPIVDSQIGIDLEDLRRVAKASEVLIAGGEFEVGLAHFDKLLSLDAIHFVMPDVKHCGGIQVALEVAMVAAAKGVKVSPHNPSGPISTLGSAHVAAISPTLDSLEIAWGELLPDQGLIDPALKIVSGTLIMPEGPGLGARLVNDTVERLRIPL